MAQSSYSLEFNGSTGYVQLASPISSGTGDFTLNTWVRFDSTPNIYIWVANTGDSGNIFFGTLGSPSSISVRLNSTTFQSFTVPTMTVEGGWYLVSLRFVASGPTLHLYLNGTESSSGGQTYPAGDGITFDTLGGYTFNQAFDLPGGLDDVSYFASDIGEANISALAAGTISPGSLFPDGWWRMEEGTGGITADSSANANTGTFHGGVTWSSLGDVPTNLVSDITFDYASNSGYQAAASSYSWSHVTAWQNRYLTVGVGMLSLAQTVTGITYAGAAMSFLGAKNSVSGAARIELWGLANPSLGSNTIAVTLSGSIASAAGAVSFCGVNQTSSTESFNSAQATNVGAADATVNVTTVANYDWIIDVVATSDTAITVGSGQTSQVNVTGAGGSAAMATFPNENPAGTVAMYWTNVGALATWSIGAIGIRPVSAPSPPSGAQFNPAWARNTNLLIGCGVY